MLGVWFATLVMDSRHAGSLVYYTLVMDSRHAGSLVYYTLVMDSRHAGSLVCYLSGGLKACWESGLLP